MNAKHFSWWGLIFNGDIQKIWYFTRQLNIQRIICDDYFILIIYLLLCIVLRSHMKWEMLVSMIITPTVLLDNCKMKKNQNYSYFFAVASFSVQCWNLNIACHSFSVDFWFLKIMHHFLLVFWRVARKKDLICFPSFVKSLRWKKGNY